VPPEASVWLPLTNGIFSLSDVALEFLDAYLLSEDSPDGSMLLSDLDGFLTGIACSPESISSDDWLPSVWRSGSPRDGKRHEKAVQAILARHKEIVRLLNAEPSAIEPVFWEDQAGNAIAMDWCEGFMDACALQPEPWAEFMKDDDGRDLMMPILAHLFNDDGESVIGIDEVDLEDALDAASADIVEVVPLIHAHWKSKRRSLN
jgi:uncharacterized protein